MFVKSPLTATTVKSLPCYVDLFAALIAANRAVAHINPDFVDHDYDGNLPEERLGAVITAIEGLIKKHIYGSATDYDAAMSIEGNLMHRRRPIRGVKS